MSWGFKVAGLMALGGIMLGAILTAHTLGEQMFWAGVTVLMFAGAIVTSIPEQ